MTNPLLGRKQFSVDVLHPGAAAVSKKDISDKIASKFKVKDDKCIILFGFGTAFGGGRSTGMGLIYESVEKLKKFEPKFRKKRFGHVEKEFKERSAHKGHAGRKPYKDAKRKMKRVRGKEKIATYGARMQKDKYSGYAKA